MDEKKSLNRVYYTELKEWILSFLNDWVDPYEDYIYDTCINMRDGEVEIFTLEVEGVSHTFKVSCIPDDEELIFDAEKIS